MLQISGICNDNHETIVLCHLPTSKHGMGYKGGEFWTVYCCMTG
ncbi:nuclease domain-containing protein [Pectobacterium brasiliense]|nr:nuclease domain-containing protein [Pectobacterium brasiliense]